MDSSGFSLQNKKQGSLLELFHCSHFRIQSPRLKGQSLMYNIINSTTIVQALLRVPANIVRIKAWDHPVLLPGSQQNAVKF